MVVERASVLRAADESPASASSRAVGGQDRTARSICARTDYGFAVMPLPFWSDFDACGFCRAGGSGGGGPDDCEPDGAAGDHDRDGARGLARLDGCGGAARVDVGGRPLEQTFGPMTRSASLGGGR